MVRNGREAQGVKRGLMAVQVQSADIVVIHSEEPPGSGVWPAPSLDV